MINEHPQILNVEIRYENFTPQFYPCQRFSNTIYTMVTLTNTQYTRVLTKEIVMINADLSYICGKMFSSTSICLCVCLESVDCQNP